MDEAGYLEANLLETAYRLNVALNEVEAVLGVIHTFDPTGVGARSLAECIALQAKEADRYDPAMARLIDNLELLRSEEHTSELQSLMRISYAVFCLKKKTNQILIT